MSLLKVRLSSASLFVRMVALLVATVLATQALTFALVLAMPTPSLPTTSVATIVGALRTGRTTQETLAISYGARPRDNWVDPSERAMTTQLAIALGVPQDKVRVIFLRVFDSGPPDRPRMRDPVGLPLPAPAAGRFGLGPPSTIPRNDNSDAVTGRFEAALQLPDGRWRHVSLDGGRIATWQWDVLRWLLGSLAVVAPFAWFFAKRIADPIAAFADAARRLGNNPSGDPIEIDGPPEIAAASVAVNAMQHQIKRYVDDRTMMVGAIAHDLRTPLMRLSLRLQQAPDALRQASERDIDEIEAMATAALSFVRDLSSRDSRHRIALRSIVETVADEFADRGADVVLAPGEDVTLLGDPNGIKRMVTNIVGNAVVYAGSARLTLTVMPDAAVIAVADTGPGIPAAELDHVFAPFYRIERSRSRNTGGTGLGLASARAVARGHGGDILLSNRPEGGLLATIRLPL